MRTNKFSKKTFLVLVIIIFTLLILLFIAGKANPIASFKDQGLEDAIREKLDRPKGPIYQTDLAIMTELDASNKGIESLEGIDQLKRLASLNLEDNYVKDVSPLSSIEKLKELNLRNNSITNLEDISFNSITHLSLRQLNLRHNVDKENREKSARLSDIELLKNFSELEKLDLRDNHINDLSPIEDLTKLKKLNLRENNIKDIKSLSNLRFLENLNLRDNKIDSIEVLSTLINLKYLNIHSITSIKSLEPIKYLGNLETLIIRNLPIENHPDLFDNLTKLQRLNAIDTGIENLNPQIFYKLRSLGALNEDVRPVTIIENIEPPVFSHASGFYERGFKLKLDPQVKNGKIYYTLDGSEPNIDSDVYIEDSFIPINDDNKDKANIVRAKIIKNDNNISKTITNTYFIDKNIKDRFTLPVVAIATDDDNLFDSKKGIYSEQNYKKRGSDWERPIHVDFFESDGSLAFEQNGGIRIHGAATRVFDQKSLRLYASSEYDEKDEFEYKIFNNLKQINNKKYLSNFKRLILRNSGNDWTSTMFRDALLQSLVEPLGTMDTQAYRPSIVYINGEYWGIYNIRERYDEYYLKENYDVPEDKVSILELNGKISFGDDKGEKHYEDMLNYIRKNGLSKKENYAYIQTQMDTENYRDYIIAETFFANQDWPHNNIRFWRHMTDDYIKDAPYGHDGRWRWMLYDTDHGFARSVHPINEKHQRRDYTHNTINWIMGEFGGWDLDLNWPNFLIREIFENEDFKIDFLNRYSDLLNSYFLPETVIANIDKFEAKIEPEMPNHIQRWSKIDDMELWHYFVNVMREFSSERPSYIRKHLMDQFHIDDTVDISVSNDFEKGSVKINSIIIDEGLPGTNNSKLWTGIYFKNIPITIEALPKKGYEFSHWEGLDSNYTDKNININPMKETNIKAVFKKIK